MEFSAIASAMALSRKNHLSAVFQMLLFPKSKHNGVTVFDFSRPDANLTQLQTKHQSTSTYVSYNEGDHTNGPTLEACVLL